MKPFPGRIVLAVLCATLGCGVSDSTGGLGSYGQAGPCALDARYLSLTAAAKDAIPSIDDPVWADPVSSDGRWRPRAFDHVIGFVVDGQSYAVPINLLWYHEIVNATLPTGGGVVDLAITHCPLTGTSMVFDRAPAGGAELGVSGVLYQSNLVMYDRNQDESWWPQMFGAARCGPIEGTQLPLYRSIEMRWDGWLDLHPDGKVLESPPGTARVYDTNPYSGYDAPDAEYTFPMPPLDARLPPKARVLGVAHPGAPSWVFPFTELEARGAYAAIDRSFGTGAAEAVVLWDRDREAAAAYHRVVNGTVLGFAEDQNGFYDVDTGSRWSVEGIATSGPLLGETLDPVSRSYVSFWGAWAAFFGFPLIWGQRGPGGPA